MQSRILVLWVALLLAGCEKKSDAPQENTAKPATKAAAIDPATAATVNGMVLFDGAPPKSQPIDMSQDPACVQPGIPANYSQAYAVEGGKLANVYVYVKDGPGNTAYDPPAQPATFDQKGCRYVPHVIGVMAGQKVLVMNSDLAMHNVHPSPKQNRTWNESQMPKGEPIETAFKNPELMIPVECNQHPWMRMYVNVSSHPFFAVTGKDGRFEIKGLPPGEYTIAALHERMGEKTVKITVAPRESKAAGFTFSSADANAAMNSR